MTSRMPTPTEFQLTERPYAWLRELSRKTDENRNYLDQTKAIDIAVLRGKIKDIFELIESRLQQFKLESHAESASIKREMSIMLSTLTYLSTKVNLANAELSSIKREMSIMLSTLTYLSTKVNCIKNVSRQFFGAMNENDTAIDFSIPEVDVDRYYIQSFVVVSGKPTKQATIGASFIDSSTIRVNKPKSLGKINFKIVLKEL